MKRAKANLIARSCTKPFQNRRHGQYLFSSDDKFSALLWKITSLEQQICKLQDSMATIIQQNEEFMKYKNVQVPMQTQMTSERIFQQNNPTSAPQNISEILRLSLDELPSPTDDDVDEINQEMVDLFGDGSSFRE